MKKISNNNIIFYLSVVYLIISFICLVKSNMLANNLFKNYQETTDFNNILTLSFCKKIIILLSIIGIILNGFIILRKNKDDNKIRIISIINLFISINSIQKVISIIDILLSFNFVSYNEYMKIKKIEKTNIPKMSYKKISLYEIINSVLLLLFYFCFDKFGSVLVNSINGYIIVTILFYIIMGCFCYLSFENELVYSFNKFKKNIKKYISFIGKKLLLGYFLEILATLIVFAIIGEYTSVNQNYLEQLPFIYMCITAILFAPFIEEILFRGCIRRFIKNDIVFVIISGVVFGLLHTMIEPTLIKVILVALPYISLGCVLAYSYAKTNNIWTNIFMHMTINTISCLLMFLIK